MTPMLQQYLSIKAAHPNSLLLYRLGDFYELFFEDAIVASQILDIALTKRGQHLDQNIPMCGIPVFSLSNYLDRLVRAGHCVAICEQLETPMEAKKRGYKAVVRREVVRVVTSGTILEEQLLPTGAANYLAAVVQQNSHMALAWVEVSTGECCFSNVTAAGLATELARLQPSELIVPEALHKQDELSPCWQELHNRLTVRADSLFAAARAQQVLCDFYQLHTISGIAAMEPHHLCAVGALLDYLNHTHRQQKPRISLPKAVITNHFMTIDAATRRNLEIECRQDGSKKGSLLWALDHTVTASGSRLLRFYLTSPLVDAGAINQRLDSVSSLYQKHDLRAALIDALRKFPDVERAVARIYSKGGPPRDLMHILKGLQAAVTLNSLLLLHQDSYLKRQVSQLLVFSSLMELLESALAEAHDDTGDGWIKALFNPQLDKLRDLRDNSDVNINKLRNEYRQQTGINSLKISRNNIIGYYVEVPVSQTNMLPKWFHHKQTLGSVARFFTDQLKEVEREINSCQEKIDSIAQEVLQQLAAEVRKWAEQLSAMAQAVAVIDVICSLAEISFHRGYARPKVDNSRQFDIKDGVHPVLQLALKEQCMANDCNLGASSNTWLVTGPNMGGKSTFLRQNALICLMAQMGCFVPAGSAHIGIVDKLFSRIGAGDDISRGQSTFMMEMSETAAIINNATAKSLVILDEIGRGTSTFDGLSIAWAVIEYIHQQIACRTLFATHYHELVKLESMLSGLVCHTTLVKEWEGKLIFMHKICPGFTDRSYGIHVAELAGVPASVINRANAILMQLEEPNLTKAYSTAD